MSEDSTGLELVSFRMAEQDFCIDIMQVREIRGWTQSTALPQSPDFVCGVINLRGTVLPVVDPSGAEVTGVVGAAAGPATIGAPPLNRLLPAPQPASAPASANAAARFQTGCTQAARIEAARIRAALMRDTRACRTAPPWWPGISGSPETRLQQCAIRAYCRQIGRDERSPTRAAKNDECD